MLPQGEWHGQTPGDWNKIPCLGNSSDCVCLARERKESCEKNATREIGRVRGGVLGATEAQRKGVGERPRWRLGAVSCDSSAPPPSGSSSLLSLSTARSLLDNQGGSKAAQEKASTARSTSLAGQTRKS